jgi:HD-GYP domain-containing protein (c-di-GMP phosphodiesterase class II)
LRCARRPTEIAVKAAALRTDFTRPRDVLLGYLPNLAPQAGLVHRLRAAGVAVARARSITAGYSRANCEVAALTARRLGLGQGVERSLSAVFEQVDGKGAPQGLSSDQIPLPARVAQVAVYAALFDRINGPQLAAATIRRRAGRALDAEVAAAFCRVAPELLEELRAEDAVPAAVAAEPAPAVALPQPDVDEVCRAFGEAVDLKTPYLHGHSVGVARLARAGAERMGLPADQAGAVFRAGLLHDLGRAAVPNGVWEKPGRLSTAEWERVRLHAYHSERIVKACPALASLAPAAGMHHERLDGTGYHREARAASIPMNARLLAASDVFQAMTQERPHRASRAPEDAARALTREAEAGRLDADAVAAVRAAAGHALRGRRPRPGGLTDRQLEVLRLVARGLSNRQIAARLVVSPRTAERHVQDIYARIGVSTRAGAALYGMQHDLLG